MKNLETEQNHLTSYRNFGSHSTLQFLTENSFRQYQGTQRQINNVIKKRKRENPKEGEINFIYKILLRARQWKWKNHFYPIPYSTKMKTFCINREQTKFIEGEICRCKTICLLLEYNRSQVQKHDRQRKCLLISTHCRIALFD